MTTEGHDLDALIKVVPMYLEGEEPDSGESGSLPGERARSQALGLVGVVLAVATVAAVVVGIVVATGGDYGPATILGYAAIVLSGLAVLAGIVAVVVDSGRRWGVIAIAAGILGDPVVLLAVLRFFGGFQAG